MSTYAKHSYTERGFVRLAKALSDPNRARVLLALRGGELCVCQVVELLRLAPSTVSRHMAVLRDALLVDSRKEGRWAYYRRAGDAAPAAVRMALEWVDASLESTPACEDDARALERIRSVPVEELCKRGGPAGSNGAGA